MNFVVFEVEFLSSLLRLTALEQQYGNLTQIKVDEVTGFMRHVRSKIPTNNTVPCGIVFLVEFLFDVSGNILKRNEKGKGN